MPRTLLVAALALASCRPSKPTASPRDEPSLSPASSSTPWTGVTLEPIAPNSDLVRAVPHSFGTALALPRSNAFDPMRDGAAIVVGRTFVSIGDAEVATVKGGVIAAPDLQGYEVRGLVAPLAAEAARLDAAAKARGDQWSRSAVVLMDAGTQFGSLLEILYTANGRGFGNYQLAVDVGDSETRAVLDVAPPKYVVEGGARKIVDGDRPGVAIRIFEDRLWLRDSKDVTTELTFAETNAGQRAELLAWAKTQANALHGESTALPHVVVSATSPVTAARLVAVLSTVSGPDCGATQKQAGDRERCFFPHRIIQSSAETADDAPQARVKGSLDKDVIRKVMRANIGSVSACYNAGLARDPKIRGRVAIQFTIGPSGNVPVAVVSNSEVADAEVGKCIVAVVKGLVFPAPKGGGNVVVTYPFVLETDPPKPQP